MNRVLKLFRLNSKLSEFSTLAYMKSMVSRHTKEELGTKEQEALAS